MCHMFIKMLLGETCDKDLAPLIPPFHRRSIELYNGFSWKAP